MVNQFVYLMLLPLVGASLPDAFLEFLKGYSFCLFNFDFLKFENIKYYKDSVDYFDCSSNNSYLDSIGVGSKCAVPNHLKALHVIIMVVILHLSYLILYKLLNKASGWKKKILDWVFMFFTLTIYIRLIFQGYIIVLLSVLTELYTANFSNSMHILSYCISLLLLAGLITVLILSFVFGLKSKNSLFISDSSYFKEFLEGAKQTKYGKQLNFILLLRAMLSVAWIVFLQDTPDYVRIIGYVTIQVAFCTLKLIIRPYEALKDNISEFINDMFYIFA